MMTFMLIGCSNSASDWAFNFVVYQNNIYNVSNQTLDHVEQQLGEIDKLVTKEATYNYKRTFSNKYPVGTKIFKISNIDISKSIAIEIGEGTYLQADNQGEYGK
ncbi:hypothetical protein ACFSTH_10220 [Paenibacillus yanchengensis]|uniref:Uncharacterized protein n=1 Tax=Paenibacillus yanchengensis TaxID=2035833 RepID=A0ABW4YNL5_9BACL